MFVNFAANRSFNDLTQYPVFPWIITDYKNETFPEEKPFVANQNLQHGWRDLSKPIGALSIEKLEQSKSKYFQLVGKDPITSPFLRSANTAKPK